MHHHHHQQHQQQQLLAARPRLIRIRIDDARTTVLSSSPPSAHPQHLQSVSVASLPPLPLSPLACSTTGSLAHSRSATAGSSTSAASSSSATAPPALAASALSAELSSIAAAQKAHHSSQTRIASLLDSTAPQLEPLKSIAQELQTLCQTQHIVDLKQPASIAAATEQPHSSSVATNADQSNIASSRKPATVFHSLSSTTDPAQLFRVPKASLSMLLDRTMALKVDAHDKNTVQARLDLADSIQSRMNLLDACSSLSHAAATGGTFGSASSISGVASTAHMHTAAAASQTTSASESSASSVTHGGLVGLSQSHSLPILPPLSQLPKPEATPKGTVGQSMIMPTLKQLHASVFSQDRCESATASGSALLAGMATDAMDQTAFPEHGCTSSFQDLLIDEDAMTTETIVLDGDAVVIYVMPQSAYNSEDVMSVTDSESDLFVDASGLAGSGIGSRLGHPSATSSAHDSDGDAEWEVV
ncbi:hypothetical protein BC831DRAFT_449412 [Entophlyctis helioformis]|nr:hypothetical protein BC831DRAFT_449412 [Entophlyctis helioformis]